MSRLTFGLLLLASAIPCAANSPMLADSSGRAIGYFLGNIEYCSGDDGAVLTAQNYIACVRVGNGKIETGVRPFANSPTMIGNEPFYISNDCSGQAFVTASNSVSFAGGEVIATNFLGVQYLPLGATSQSLVMNTAGASGMCSGAGTASLPVIAIQPNALSITGLSSVPYAPPLSVRVLPDSALLDEIFFDMFDDSY